MNPARYQDPANPAPADRSKNTASGDAHRAMERPSTSSLRSSFSASVQGRTIRAVTPEPPDRLSPGVPSTTVTADSTATLSTDSVTPVSTSAPGLPAAIDPDDPPPLPTRPRTIALNSPQASPRTLPGGPMRRQGMVFNDSFDGPDAPSDDAPANLMNPPPQRAPPRQRTYTMEGASVRQPPVSLSPAGDTRRRIGSFSAAGLQQQGTDSPLSQDPLDPLTFPSSGRQPESPHTEQYQAQRAQPTKDRKLTTRRLIKRQSSRPTSPLISTPPSVDSLPLPITTDDANKVLLLMKSLCGRMRGEVEYQFEAGGPWTAGMAYIEEEKGSLMFDSGQDGPFHSCLIADLRGCRVIPVDYPEKGRYKCLEILGSHFTIDMILRPLVPAEADLWLAALLCWQQLRPVSGPMMNGKPTNPVAPTRPELRRHTSSAGQNVRPTSIIKIGRVMLWDKGLATSPRAVVKRPSTRDLRSPTSTWRMVSCILQDNGELKLLTESDSCILSVIELSQLSRSAIQPLDRTVLDEEFCIAIFPIYTSTSTQLSVFRPVYLALDTRVHFEVWFVLLRAFAVPDLYRLDQQHQSGIVEAREMEPTSFDGVFRVEKSLSLRVTEAKLRMKHSGPLEAPTLSNSSESLVGNYFAEVILDGEVRARTTIKTHTKNPFWRAGYEFDDLQASSQYLSVVLKRVDGHVDTSHQPQALLNVSKQGGPAEVMCGSVDIAIDELERGRDHEQWLQILDDQQQCIGTMLVKLYHEELIVLPEKEYQPLSELLHRFPSGLTSQIAEAMPSNLRRLSEIFLNIFQVSGKAADWLMALVEDEIDGIGSQTSIKKYRFSRRLRSNDSLESSTSDREQIVRDMSRSLTGEANLLFRGNSLLTQALEFHMRRLGKEYLQEVLGDKVVEINDMNPDCEVDPSRIRNGDELQQHWNQLIQLSTEVWDCIAGSADLLPPELRHILKYIRAVADDRYGDFLRTVSYTSVSGFLFLRFICPAILSPNLFGLLHDLPRPRAQRTFTLIAKTLQALANMTTFGQKEWWMEPMNKFLTAQRRSMKELIDQVCAIPADRSTKPLPAPYSTPVTIMGRLSPTAKEGFLSLPYLLDGSRNFAALVRLWVDANPLAEDRNHRSHTTPSSPQAAPRTTLFPPMLDSQSGDDLRAFNDICSSLQHRCDASLAHVEALRQNDRSPDSEGHAEIMTSVQSQWDADELTYAPTGSPVPLNVPGALFEERGTMIEGSAGTSKGSRNRGTRGLLSGIMKMGRSNSPDAVGKGA
ncbi:hypothetical protein VUR80DRAFT_8749 [Thermomyces stellatus]